MKTILKILASFLLSLNLSVHGQIITTIAGNGTNGYAGDGGPAISASLSFPMGVTFDKYGNLYFADTSSVIRKINSAGIISTVAGNGTTSSSGDGGPAALAGLFVPINVAFDSFDNMYIAEQSGAKIRIVNTSGIITTFAGTGVQGNSGDNGQAALAQINTPSGVIVDKNDNVYFVDYLNNNIRKVNASGIISTIAGTGVSGYSGDNGPATAAKLCEPYGICIDPAGNIYLSDHGNNVIRKIDTNGIITTIVGNGFGACAGLGGYSGDNGPAISAKLYGPTQVILDTYGNLYFSDWYNNVIRRVNSTGIISTIAGTGVAGYFGDGGSAILAQLNQPFGIALDSICNLHISDSQNNVIRKVTPVCVVGVEEYFDNTQIFSVFPNPASFSISLNIKDEEILKSSFIVIYNSLGQMVKKIPFSKTILVNDLPYGFYFLEINSPGKLAIRSQFVKE